MASETSRVDQTWIVWLNPTHFGTAGTGRDTSLGQKAWKKNLFGNEERALELR